MEISKENVFKAQYTSVLGENIKKTRTSSKIFKFIKDNRIISITALVFLICISLNMILIYNFFRVMIYLG